MNQPPLLYGTAPAVSLIEPWLCQHLPDLPSAVRRRFIQLVSGIFETRSLLIDTIADSSAFGATATSNATQVRRILRDLRLTLETVYYPFIRSILATVPATDLYLTVDETSHGTDYNVVQVGWATDGMSLPLGIVGYAPAAAWADDTRVLLHTLDTLIPEGMTVTLLADRIHTGEPFLACLDTLQWNYVFRASETTHIEHPTKGLVHDILGRLLGGRGEHPLIVEHARRGWRGHRERPLAFDRQAKGRIAIINQSGAATLRPGRGGLDAWSTLMGLAQEPQRPECTTHSH